MPTTILDGETYEQARHRRFTEEAKVIEKIQQDEIIRMAREAGYDPVSETIPSFHSFIECFAALVAAHEREKPVTFPANGLLVQEPSRDTPTGSQSGEIIQQPFAYYCEKRNINGELIDKEYNGINQFSAGRFGKPLYTAEQREVAVLAEREACAKVCDELQNDAVAKYFDANAGECAAAIRARNNND